MTRMTGAKRKIVKAAVDAAIQQLKVAEPLAAMQSSDQNGTDAALMVAVNEASIAIDAARSAIR